MSKKQAETAVATQDDMQARMLALKEDAAQKQAQLAELGIDSGDLVIPLIQIMQGTSEMVGEGQAVLGEIVNMQSQEKLGAFDKPIKILPLKMYKTMRTYDVTNNGFKFMFEEPLTPANDKLTGEGVIDGVPVKRYHTMNFFVLVKSDLDKGEGFPCLIRFRSTGMNAGRALATHLYKRVHLRQLPYSQYVELSSKREKKDTATYGAWVLGKPENASKEDMAVAESWLATLAKATVKIDEHDDVGAEERVSAAKPVVVDGEVVGSAAGSY